VGVLTGTEHGEAANDLVAFYQGKAAALSDAGEFYLAAIALAFAAETALLAYLLVEFGEDNGGELQVPDRVGFADLIEAAREIDVLAAPINVPHHANEEGNETPPKHLAQNVIDDIRAFRNLIHPARALADGFDPRTFGKPDYEALAERYDALRHSLLFYI